MRKKAPGCRQETETGPVSALLYLFLLLGCFVSLVVHLASVYGSFNCLCGNFASLFLVPCCLFWSF